LQVCREYTQKRDRKFFKQRVESRAERRSYTLLDFGFAGIQANASRGERAARIDGSRDHSGTVEERRFSAVLGEGREGALAPVRRWKGRSRLQSCRKAKKKKSGLSR